MPPWSTRAFGAAGASVVLEELLTGPEVSFFVVANGEAYVPLLSAQDHKRIFDDDRGPNTGGMGAFSPSPLMNDELQSHIEREIVQPVLRGMAAEGQSVSRLSLLRIDADARRPEGDRIQRAGSAIQKRRWCCRCCRIRCSDLLVWMGDGYSRRRETAGDQRPLKRSLSNRRLSPSASSSLLTVIPATFAPAT